MTGRATLAGRSPTGAPPAPVFLLAYVFTSLCNRLPLGQHCAAQAVLLALATAYDLATKVSRTVRLCVCLWSCP